MKNKQTRLDELIKWRTKVPAIRIVFDYMLENPHITQKIFNDKLNIKGPIGLSMNQLRNQGADITSIRHKAGGCTFYSLRHKPVLSTAIKHMQNGVLKDNVSMGNSQRFKVLNTDTDTHLEVPVYYWKDDKGVIYIDQELMSEHFNEKLHQLTKKHDNDRQMYLTSTDVSDS
jgi:hypothetical protein